MCLMGTQVMTRKCKNEKMIDGTPCQKGRVYMMIFMTQYLEVDGKKPNVYVYGPCFFLLCYDFLPNILSRCLGVTAAFPLCDQDARQIRNGHQVRFEG